MRRVTFVVPWGEALGGAEMMLLSLLRHVDRTRVAPSVIFLQPGPFEHQVATLSVETRALSAGRMREVRRFRRTTVELTEALHALAPDVVCAWSAKAHLYTAVAARRRRAAPRPVRMWWQHGIPEGEWLDRLATALPGVVGCSSHAGAVAQRRLWPHRRTYVVHPGTEPVSCGERVDLQVELAIPRDRVLIAIVGRLQPWKNQHRLLEAVAQLRSEGLPVHALIIGGSAYGLSPEYPARIEAMIKSLRLRDAVTLTGHVADARRLLPAADVLVNASDAEPFGIVLIEAMAAGLPVVAVDRGGPSEIVEDTVSGLLVASSAPADLATALRRLARDRTLRARLGAGGYERYAQQFTAQHMADRFASMVEDMPG